MEKTEMMKRYEVETDECATWTWHEREFLTDDYLAWLEAKAAAYDRLIEKLSLWGKHLKSASMTQNSLDFIYCAQQVMDEITLTLPDGWEES